MTRQCRCPTASLLKPPAIFVACQSLFCGNNACSIRSNEATIYLVWWIYLENFLTIIYGPFQPHYNKSCLRINVNCTYLALPVHCNIRCRKGKCLFAFSIFNVAISFAFSTSNVAMQRHKPDCTNRGLFFHAHYT